MNDEDVVTLVNQQLLEAGITNVQATSDYSGCTMCPMGKGSPACIRECRLLPPAVTFTSNCDTVQGDVDTYKISDILKYVLNILEAHG